MKSMILVKSNPGLEKRLDLIDTAAMKAPMAEMNAFNDALRKPA